MAKGKNAPEWYESPETKKELLPHGMDRKNAIVSAAGLNLLIMGVGTVLAGAGVAAVHGNMALLIAILCLLFTIFCQLCSQFAHKYIDIAHNYHETAGVEMKEESRSVRAEIGKATSTAMFLLAASVGIAIMGLCGWWTLLFGLIVFFIMYIFNAGKYPLNRTPFAVISPWLLFGPVGVIGTELVQSVYTPGGIWYWTEIRPALLLGMAMGFLAANVQLAFCYNHYEADKQYGKDTLIVRIGKKRGRYLVVTNGILAVICCSICIYFSPVNNIWLMFLPAFVGLIGSLTMATLMKFNRRELRELIMNIAIWTTGICGLLIFVLGLCLSNDGGASVMHI